MKYQSMLSLMVFAAIASIERSMAGTHVNTAAESFDASADVEEHRRSGISAESVEGLESMEGWREKIVLQMLQHPQMKEILSRDLQDPDAEAATEEGPANVDTPATVMKEGPVGSLLDLDSPMMQNIRQLSKDPKIQELADALSENPGDWDALQQVMKDSRMQELLSQMFEDPVQEAETEAVAQHLRSE